LVLSALTLAACGAAQSGSSSNDGPEAWRELTSEHFTVWTDSSQGDARQLVETLEHLRQVVLGVSFFQKDVPGRSFVIAFRSLDEVHAYIPPQFIAHAWGPQNMLWQPIVTLSTESLEKDIRIVTHELTHVVAYSAIPVEPQWFAEGLAGYFETVRIDVAGKKAELGRPLDFRLQEIHRKGLMPIAQLFACSKPTCMDDRFYASAWAVVTYLVNQHPTELVQYLQRLHETTEDQQAALWDEVFPTLPPSVLEKQVSQWIAYGSVQIRSYTVEYKAAPFAERPLTAGDALAARGVLRWLFAPTVMSDETTKALDGDPTAILPNLMSLATKHSAEPGAARAVAAAHPEDWRVWMLVGYATRGTPESHDAFTKACAQRENTPTAFPPSACGRLAQDAGPDPRWDVFRAATGEINECFSLAKSPLSNDRSLDININSTGAVTAAHAATGDPTTNACIEALLMKLTFPADHAGPFHIGTKPPN
jgi:hypothetical protein